MRQKTCELRQERTNPGQNVVEGGGGESGTIRLLGEEKRRLGICLALNQA
jgi:hypothetical protein